MRQAKRRLVAGEIARPAHDDYLLDPGFARALDDPLEVVCKFFALDMGMAVDQPGEVRGRCLAVNNPS